MAKVSNIENDLSSMPANAFGIQQSMAQEKSKYRSSCNERFNIYRNYFHNTLPEYNVLPYLLYGLFGIISSFLATSVFVLVPVHDVIIHPEYWYEVMMQTSAILVIMSIFFVVNCSEWMNVDIIRNIRNIFCVIIVVVTTYNITWCLFYIVWTYGFKKKWPIPFVAYQVTYIAIFSGWIALFYCFPKAWRKDLIFRKRIKFFLIALSFNMSGGLTYQIILKCFIISSENYQWILVFIFPFIREIYLWLTLYFGKKACDGDMQRLVIITTHYTNARHATILATIVGSYVPAEASYVLFAFDVILNLYTCLSIVWNTKKKGDLEKRIHLLQELAINELVEIVVPLTYLLCFVAAYYGPNAKVIGNIKNSYWQYEAEDNVQHVITNVLLYFIVDLACGTLCTFILYKICGISLLHVCASLCKEFGMVFALNMAVDFSCVSKIFHSCKR